MVSYMAKCLKKDMAETPCELLVALSLDSSNFSRNMRTINA